MRVAILALLLLASGVEAKSGTSGGHASRAHASPAPATNSKRAGGGGGGMAGSHLRQKAPPLAPDRKIHEQDCTKPIDWSSGNISCK